MALNTKKISAGMTIALAGALALAACSSTTAPAGGTAAGNTAQPAPMASSMAPSPTASTMAMNAYSNLVGAGCAAYDKAVPDGAGSVQGMSQDPVAVAASNNPLLTTLVAAVSGKLNPNVNLVDTLNGGEFTVFAPVDDAFAKIDPATIDTLKKNSALLTSILTYHVIPGQIEPNAIDGTFTTVNGAQLTITGSGDHIMVNGNATVICGGVQTANATVYLIDSVLMPPAA